MLHPFSRAVLAGAWWLMLAAAVQAQAPGAKPATPAAAGPAKTGAQAGKEPDVLVRVPRLTLDYAQKIATAAMLSCRRDGIQAGVTVVDRNGTIQAALRDTLAPVITLEISRQKAVTAANFAAATSALEDRFTKPFSVGKVDGLVFSGGGLPIEAAGNIVGAVGVSGAPTGQQDEKCAQDGLKAVATDLEMAN